MKKLTIAFLSIVGLLAFGELKAQSTLSPIDYVAKLKASPNAQVVDVRTPQEYQAGHLQVAKLININDSDFQQQIEKLDKNRPVFVYCAAGVRSSKAATILKNIGFKEVVNLKGGYQDLIKSGLK